MSIYAINDAGARRDIHWGAGLAVAAVSFRSGGLCPVFTIGGTLSAALIYPLIFWPSYRFLKRTGRLTIWWALCVAATAVALPDMVLTMFSHLNSDSFSLEVKGVQMVRTGDLTLAG